MSDDQGASARDPVVVVREHVGSRIAHLERRMDELGAQLDGRIKWQIDAANNLEVMEAVCSAAVLYFEQQQLECPWNNAIPCRDCSACKLEAAIAAYMKHCEERPK